MKVKLTNGVIIETNSDGEFPPLQDVVNTTDACGVCPVKSFCRENNNFRCLTGFMFSGYYCSLWDAVEMTNTWHEEQFDNENDGCMVCGAGPTRHKKSCH